MQFAAAVLMLHVQELAAHCGSLFLSPHATSQAMHHLSLLERLFRGEGRAGSTAAAAAAASAAVPHGMPAQPGEAGPALLGGSSRAQRPAPVPSIQPAAVEGSHGAQTSAWR